VGLSLYLPQSAGKTAVPPLGAALSGTVTGVAPEMLSPFPVPSAGRFDSAHASTELSWSPSGRPLCIPGTFQLKTHAGYTIRIKKEPFWDASFSAVLRFKYGRISVKAAASELSERKPFLNPGVWDYTISWRLEK
jgi:hypothetical protein